MGLTSQQFIRLLQIFSAKLVLEVFGGAGAIWGFSEAMTFRVPSTVWFWRPTALTFGAIFFIRWIMQIQDYVVEANESNAKVVKQASSVITNTSGKDLEMEPESEKYGSTAPCDLAEETTELI
jgi:hypothetical protein